MVNLTTDYNVAYKFKDASGKWTPFLHYLSERGGNYVFEPVNKQEGVLAIFMAAAQDLDNLKAKVFIQCKFYCEWVEAPHVCGKDCPLS